jgi:cyclopropane fatty-acyl-phospholipid synthase-like methyltransferase
MNSIEIYDCERNISKIAFEVVEYLELHSLLNKPISILDYGCGNGEVAKFVAEKTNYQRYKQ